MPPLAPDACNGLDQRVELRNVVTVCAGQDDRERDALRVDDEVVLAAGLAPVRGIRAGFLLISQQPLSGLVLQQRLHASHKHLPLIFMTAHGDIEMSVQAMKRGAFDFFTKPFREQDMLDAVSGALENSCRQQANDRAFVRLVRCYESLMPRERDVLALIVDGHRNKEIAKSWALARPLSKSIVPRR
jgi:FixJ family two-component response regulator